MSGKITNNNGDLRKAFFGNAEVNKIYLGNTELYSKAAPVTYTLTNTLSNISVDAVEVNNVSVGSIPSTVSPGDIVEMIFTCASGYEIPSSITVNGVTVGVGLGDVSANGCTANYMAFQSTTNRCFIVLKNFTANTSFTVTAQSSGGHEATITFQNCKGYQAPYLIFDAGISQNYRYYFSSSNQIGSLSSANGTVNVTTTTGKVYIVPYTAGEVGEGSVTPQPIKHRNAYVDGDLYSNAYFCEFDISSNIIITIDGFGWDD